MIEHRWSECEMCGPMVICGKCGNNACNGGYGTLPNGSQCDACPSAYTKQDEEYEAMAKSSDSGTLVIDGGTTF